MVLASELSRVDTDPWDHVWALAETTLAVIECLDSDGSFLEFRQSNTVPTQTTTRGNTLEAHAHWDGEGKQVLGNERGKCLNDNRNKRCLRSTCFWGQLGLVGNTWWLSDCSCFQPWRNLLHTLHTECTVTRSHRLNEIGLGVYTKVTDMWWTFYTLLWYSQLQ